MMNEKTHLHSHSKFVHYDAEGLGLLSSSDACDVQLAIKRENSFDSNNSTERARVTKISLFSNIGLLIIKVIVSYYSGSLAFVASAVDSVLDLVSQTIIFCAMRGNENVDERKWPLGRARLEPVGIVVVASLMGIASLQVVMESFIRLIDGYNHEKDIKSPNVNTLTIALLLITIGIKILLYFVCIKLSSNSDSMLALAEDHKNDVMSNTIALLAAWLASNHKILWFLDPVGAIGISIFIVMNWVEMAREQTDKLVGRAAEMEFIKQIEKIAIDHSREIEVDVVRAYHFGHRFLVEIEIVMPDTTTLRVAHDVALDLQQKVELLTEVERCHVHVDYAFRTEREHKATFLSEDVS